MEISKKAPLLINQQPIVSNFPNGTQQNPTIVYVVPDRRSVNSYELTNNHPTNIYPRYHPHNIYCYAKKSRCNCCCVCTALFCCLLVIVGAVVGAVIGFMAMKCVQLNHTNIQQFDGFGSNYTYIYGELNHANVHISQNHSISELTVSIVRKASSNDLLSNDTLSINFNDAHGLLITLNEQGVWWNSITICQSLDVYIQFPANMTNFPSTSINTQGGDIDFQLDGGNLINFDTLSLTSTDGDVSLDALSEINANSIVAGSTNGDVSVNSIVCTSLTASTTNGDIKLGSITMNVNSSISASTTNGDVKSLTAYQGIPNENMGITISCDQYSSFASSFRTTNGDAKVLMNNYCGYFYLSSDNGDTSIQGDASFTYETDTDKSKTGYTTMNSLNYMNGKSTNGDVEVTFNNII